MTTVARADEESRSEPTIALPGAGLLSPRAVTRRRRGIRQPVVGGTLDVRPGESYEIAFVADNPGIWSDQCHTLPHAVDGLVAHVMYEGVSTPFTINGAADNQPE